ncbi:MAG: alpha-L-fucosidase [Opitutae bacterium]|nr:alpha-L-fucosidase [Opitutae bacterium]
MARWPGGAWNTQKAAGGRDVLNTQALYDQIRRLQPQVLISYKQGYLGTEDFMAPEHHFKATSEKPLELCNTLQGHSWGYDRADEGRHRNPNQVITMLKKAKAMPANLLLNTVPLPDGSVHPDDIKTLKDVGRRLRG